MLVPIYKQTRAFGEAVNNISGVVDETLTEYIKPLESEVDILTKKITKVIAEVFDIYPSLSRNMDFHALFIKKMQKNYIEMFNVHNWFIDKRTRID